MSPQLRKGQRPRPPLAHLAGLGALGATGGLFALMLGFFFITRPGATVMDAENVTIAWIGVGGLILAIIAVHVVLGKRLIALGKGHRGMP